MKLSFTLLSILITLSSIAQNHRNIENYQLVWEDNFDSLNTDIWKVQNHFDHYGGELQVYTSRPENVFIDSGNLVLRVNRENYTCPPAAVNQWGCARQNNTGNSYEYTSGWVETKEEYNTQYGYVEARISVPYGKGFWPAFWTFVGEGVPNNVNAGEIDIFEMYGYKPPFIQATNVHLDYCNENYPTYPDCSGIPSNVREHLIPNYAFKYLVYSIEWTPEIIRWKTNDQVIRTMPNPGVVDPLRIIMNMAIQVGDPPNPETIFPADIKIDYIRVYADETITAVENNSALSSDFNVFPNPSKNSFVEITSQSNQQILEIDLVNSLGQIISTSQVNAAEYQLSISELPKATYFLEIKTSGGSATKSFIKQ